jgi:NMD protein affecting ribosome stability and mRNA decay
MRLAGIRPGDIVEVDGSLAWVREVQRGGLVICWLNREQLRSVSAREVEAHWSKKRGRGA